MNDSMEAATGYGQKYLEDLLSFFGLNTEVQSSNDGEVIHLNVPNTHMNGFLIGQHGDTVRALQLLVASALKNAGYSHSRVSVDVADYMKQRAERLQAKAEGWMQQVLSAEPSEPMSLEPMNAADRRIVHQVAAEHGVASESAGMGRSRHIILTKPV